MILKPSLIFLLKEKYNENESYSFLFKQLPACVIMGQAFCVIMELAVDEQNHKKIQSERA